MTIELINDILSDLWNYDLVLIGILLSLFVLFYSFITAKRDELREISSVIKSKGTTDNPTLKLREQHAIIYIKRMQKLNKRCIWLLLFVSLHFLFCWITIRSLHNTFLVFKLILFGSSVIITILIILQIIAVFIQYKQYTKT